MSKPLFQVFSKSCHDCPWGGIVGIWQGLPPTFLSYWQRLSCGRSLNRTSVLSTSPLCDEQEDGVVTVWYSPSYDTKGDLGELNALCLYQLSISAQKTNSKNISLNSNYYLRVFLYWTWEQFARWFRLMISYKVAVKLSARAIVTWSWRICFQAHSCACWQDSVWLSISLPHHLGLSIGCLSILTPEQLVFPKKLIQERDQNGSYSLLQPNLGSDIPSVLPYSVGPIDQPWYNVEGDDTNSVNMRGWRALGAILEPTKPLI